MSATHRHAPVPGQDDGAGSSVFPAQRQGLDRLRLDTCHRAELRRDLERPTMWAVTSPGYFPARILFPFQQKIYFVRAAVQAGQGFLNAEQWKA